MAVMIPMEIRSSTLSKHERQLFDSFKHQVNDDYYILHSLGVTTHPKKLWAEADFVIISPLGIYVLEVKGGGVSFERGIWIYISHDGKRHPGHEGPWEQAKNVMFAIKKKIESDARNIGFAYGYGIIMPDEEFHYSSPEIDLNVLLCSSNWDDNLNNYIHKLEDYWIEKNRKAIGEPLKLEKRERDIVRKLLRPDIPSAYSLKSKINNIEQYLIELTREQQKILRAMEKNPRTIIEGGTGTGKTILALDKAISLANNGNRVLLLCYNHLLADNVIENLPQELVEKNLIKADAMHRYMDKVIRSYGNREKLDHADMREDYFYNNLMPQVYCETVLNLSNPSLTDELLYDTVIIDEAQDLMTQPFLDAIDVTLLDGLKSGIWHFFLDPNQNIYGKHSKDARRFLSQFSPVICSLSMNCRNCKEIAESASVISNIPVPMEGSISGGIRKIIQYSNHQDFLSKLETEIKNILDGGLEPKDFVILSTKKFENSLLKNNPKIGDYEIRDIKKFFARDIENISKDCVSPPDAVENTHIKRIDFCTMHSFKGLERNAVIAIDVEPPQSEAIRQLLHTGLTRAKCYQTIFIHKDNMTAFETNSIL